MSTITELEALVKANRELPPPAARRALRIAAGVSLDDLAQAVGVTRQAVYLWETGKRQPRGDNRKQYVRALKVLAQ